MILNIDGKEFRVGTIDLRRSWSIQEKYNATTEDGTKVREISGVYVRYNMSIRNIDSDVYDQLIETLTSTKESQTVVMPDGKNGTITFDAFFSQVSDELIKEIGGVRHWDNLSVVFEAKKPKGAVGNA